jgi:threonine synthase
MKYHSSRSIGLYKTFEEVLVSTYAPDGGLYVPEKVPIISEEDFLSMKDFTFPEVCAQILHLYSNIDVEELRSMARNSFSLFNDGKDPLPIAKLGDSRVRLLDTSLGPTFAFKDIGQQMCGQLLNYVLGKQNKKAKIVVETSGDTGPAAIYGVRGCPNVEIFCLYPQGRVSAVQELQMVTVQDANVHVYRTQGDTDEQASVLKELFRDVDFVKEQSICSVNSINWVRIAAQSSYFVWSYLELVRRGEVAFGAPVNYVIPTGAFGNAMGAFLAKRMGLPMGRIICATNANDIVHRTLTTGDMSMGVNIQVNYASISTMYSHGIITNPSFSLFADGVSCHGHPVRIQPRAHVVFHLQREPRRGAALHGSRRAPIQLHPRCGGRQARQHRAAPDPGSLLFVQRLRCRDPRHHQRD